MVGDLFEQHIEKVQAIFIETFLQPQKLKIHQIVINVFFNSEQIYNFPDLISKFILDFIYIKIWLFIDHQLMSNQTQGTIVVFLVCL